MTNRDSNEKFVQIPNTMFAWNTKYKVNNDELVVYVMLKASMHIREFDLKNSVTKTNLMLLADLCLFESQESKMKKRVFDALSSLREKGYIDFDKSVTAKQNRMFSVEIKNYNFEDVVEVDAPWSQTIRKFSHFTKINYSVIDKLLKDKDMLLYAYSEYRYIPELNYRICIEEWMAVLEVSNKTVLKNIKESEVVIKINNGYDAENQKQETNSYLPFNRSNDVEQMAEKEVFRNSKASKSEKVSEPIVDDVEETVDDVVEDEKVEETVTETVSNEDIKAIVGKITGNTREQNILKKMNDPRVTTVEQANQIQDFNYPMSLEMYKVIQDTDDYYIRECGKKKLASKLFKDNHADKLNAEIHKDHIRKQENAEKNKYRLKSFLLKYNDGETQWLDFETFSDWKKMKLIDGDDDYGYGFTSAMVRDEGQGGSVIVLSRKEAMKFLD
ncbi:hypothetical protein [Lactococcus formosensis]|uniref:hypothetical protein n=1 Tax=Lactococcus formosensis TaxID=1281486 RepID=UPI0022E769CA|nr:hypothetical protein [Lactococcus formosensis]